MARSLSEQQQTLIATFADQPEIAGTLELVWRQARASMPPGLLGDWVAGCRDIAARVGSNAAIAFLRNSPLVAAAAGPQAVAELAAQAPDLAEIAGGNAALALFLAAPHADERAPRRGARRAARVGLVVTSANEAIEFRWRRVLDCFVAARLAMTRTRALGAG